LVSTYLLYMVEDSFNLLDNSDLVDIINKAYQECHHSNQLDKLKVQSYLGINIIYLKDRVNK
jgi:hypothetical protein